MKKGNLYEETIFNCTCLIRQRSNIQYTITANNHTFRFVNPSVLLGMANNGTASLTQTSSQAIKLNYDFYYVRSDMIGEVLNSSQANTAGSFIIPLSSIDVGTSAYIGEKELPTTKRVFYPQSTAQFTITDPFGNAVDLHGAGHYFIVDLTRGE